MREKLLEIFGFLRFVWRRWNEDHCPQVAGALTYATLLATVPLFMIGVAVLSSAPMFADLIDGLKRLVLRNLVPDVARHLIFQTLAQFQENAARLTAVGLVSVVFLALMLLLFIDRTLNAIWRVRRTRPYWVSVLTYIAILLAGPPLFALSLYATTRLSPLVAEVLGTEPEYHSPLLRVVPTLLTSLAFFLIYRLLPHRRVPWPHATLGAIVAGVLFEAAKNIFSVYVRMAPTYNLVYGAFAAVPLFLIWIYVSWLTILLGAEITSSAAYWEGGLWKHPTSPSTHFRHAVRVARALMARDGAPATFRVLRRETRLPVHELEDALLRMEECGILASTRREGYRFTRPPEEISIAQLYEATVAPLGAMEPDEWDEVSPEFARAARDLRAGLERPLSELREAGAVPPAPVRKRRGGKGRNARSAR